MPMKGALQADHISKNNYEMKVIGLPDLTIVSTGTIEEELQTVELPDNTKASGGDTNPGEFTFTLPMHHKVQEIAVEAWYQEGKGPVSPGYKKPVVMTYKSISDQNVRAYTLEGCFITKRVIPEGEMGDDGEMQTTEWTLSYDNILPIF